MANNQNQKGGLRDQLSAARGALLSGGNRSVDHPKNWKEEGVDHINISTKSNTEIGRWLSMLYFREFKHPLLLNFNSLQHFNYYLLDADHRDELRTYEPTHNLKPHFGRVIRKKIPNHKALILQAMYFKILGSPIQIQRLIESELPFDGYIEIQATGIRSRYEEASWMVAGAEEIRAAFKADRNPDFRRWVDNGSTIEGIYKDILTEVAGKYNGDEGIKAVIDTFVKKSKAAYEKWKSVMEKQKKKEEPVVQPPQIETTEFESSEVLTIRDGVNLNDIVVGELIDELVAEGELTEPNVVVGLIEEVQPVDQEVPEEPALDEQFALVDPSAEVNLAEANEALAEIQEATTITAE